MSGDYTRFTHDPLKRRSGVLMQQGRVQLDSDWNESVDITKRRQRLQSLDVFGPIGVPYETTPEAFKIGVAAGPGGDLTIEPGRLYVDGLLCEAFASETPSYLAQPFYPDPPALPAGDAVVYLDVWEREVTYVEDASLLDVALGGADTATRTQTVWQLKVEGRDGAVCGLDVGDPSSAGRLSSDAVAPPALSDPCILPPKAGYRGLENRLYRVEIHSGGALGVARFKWSRDNGSIVSVVRGVAVAGAQTTLTVNRIGRDPVLRFRIDDWVTITDDHRELMGEPGEMARVIDIVESRNEIVLDRALPTGRPFGATPADLVARHTRVQRWDQTAATNTIDADGLIATAAGPIDLEDGVQVSFALDPAGGAFRDFDHWVFAVRVADASVEKLNAAPPRGVEHHYVQLAAVIGLGGPSPVATDCRPPEASDDECCCAVTVAVGEDIQQAIDSLPDVGGCVCLKAGVHQPRATIVIRRPFVRLTGESPGVFVDLANGDSVLRVEAAFGVRVEGIVFRGAIESGEGVVSLAGADDVAVTGCGMENKGPVRVVGVDVLRTDRLRVERCFIRSVEVGIRTVGFCDAPVFVENLIRPGGRGDGKLFPIGVLSQGTSAPVTVSGNRIEETAFGIVINDAHPFGEPFSGAEGSAILDNVIVVDPIERGDADRIYAIDAAAERSVVSGNRIWVRSPDHVAIRATGSNSVIGGNVVKAELKEMGDRAPVGVQIGYESEKAGVPTTEIVVADNRFEGPTSGVMATDARSPTIRDNALVGDRPERGPVTFGVMLSRVQNALVGGNRIAGVTIGLGGLSGRANRWSENDVSAVTAGLFLALEAAPAVQGNRIHDTTQVGLGAIGMIARADFIANRLTNVSYEAERATGIGAVMVAGEWHVEANEVVNVGVRPENKLQAPTTVGIFGMSILEARLESNLVVHTDFLERDPEREDRAVLIDGLYERSYDFAEGSLTIGFPLLIASNEFTGVGRTALIEVAERKVEGDFRARFERVSFDQNYCMHKTGRLEAHEQATVVLTGRSAIVMGNHIKATTKSFPSVNFSGTPGPFIGNVTNGGASNHADFPAPESAFNQIM
ncbi:DUF6519 domain-containing protein [Hansschlegelia zhihuaiae]|uniref:Periplasmic copper-binding protein NosD beta helix domain-containing protein n=1 Tax=Hansschlegelia zhihuaiae TaxID=405005 RepID=A0A4Q0MKJ9_9HYPH|nr:DUF6519 domain-containing protein [Hansschlegelia zhihuaiae]RXF74118.1 hypothetical protein EK403_07030 [Hansschlegelia zhihuaiae]